MFYLFKNSSLSQLSPTGLKYQAGTGLISVLSADRGKLALIKPLIQFLLDGVHIVRREEREGRDWCYDTHKLRRKIVFLRLYKNILQGAFLLKISFEGQEL